MLVLSRKPGKKIEIGDDIIITVVRIGPNTVRIGIEAPKGMKILRQELTLLPKLSKVFGDHSNDDLHLPHTY